MSNSSATANTTGGGAGANLSRNFAVEEKNTIVFMVPDMPIVAARHCRDELLHIVGPMLELGVVSGTV
jgi:hypothetical protein